MTSISFTDFVLTPSLLSKREVGPIHFEVHGPRKVLLTGPSGCGKSTLFRYLSGGIWPQVHKKGHVCCNATIGYLSQDYPFYGDLTVEELFQQQSMISGVNQAYVHALIKRLKMESLLKNRFKDQLSGGQRRIVQIGIEMLYQPQMLLLDEPFTGLDSERVVEIIDLLSCVHTMHPCTMLIVGHQLTDAALNFFDECVLMDTRGKTIISCPIKEIERAFDSLEVTFPSGFSLGEKLLYLAHRHKSDSIFIKPSTVSSVVEQTRGETLNRSTIRILYALILFPTLCAFKHPFRFIGKFLLMNIISIMMLVFGLLSSVSLPTFYLTVLFLSIYSGSVIAHFPECTPFEWRVLLMNGRLNLVSLMLRDVVQMIVFSFPFRILIILLLGYMNHLESILWESMVINFMYACVSIFLANSLVLMGFTPASTNTWVIVYGSLSLMVSGAVFEWSQTWLSVWSLFFPSPWAFYFMGLQANHWTLHFTVLTSFWPLYLGILFSFIYQLNYKWKVKKHVFVNV